MYCPTEFIDSDDRNGDIVEGAWREEPVAQGLEPVGRMGSNRHSQTAAGIRDTLKGYFSSPTGEVSGQYRHINPTS